MSGEVHLCMVHGLVASCGVHRTNFETEENWTPDPSQATCPACIDIHELEPRMVTTLDLAEVVTLLRELAVFRNARVATAAAALEARLRRPGKIGP